ncbi:glycoside hydrolase [Geobacter pelophilus]|uniref:Glycoside hydrolase n=1 Tax=Geoanaerobacter pelophilus TaxID=60036 RepID=A0AAW4LB36_9BACT|nr:glycoside hydrolase family 57 protein [Geoanaerobacter pelophilus]MBT0665229.1 glycoside hydrolase [Geoanaerobacter pelophilus]
MSKPLDILFIWHMHQPFYKDPVRGEYVLPWTYLHAVKDYYDMPAIVAATPGAKAVFNLVPSLLEQLEDYAAGTANDPVLRLGRMDPGDMTEDDIALMLDIFFAANRQRMIEPQPRYLELLQLAGDGDAAKRQASIRSFRRQEIIDLQVCFFLAWTGEAARNRWPEFRELLAKGRNYTVADRDRLFAAQQEVINAIIPLYRKLHDEGKAELSLSPYYHPILPLLCDMKIAQVSMPKANIPAARFCHPEDARSHIMEGIACFERIFGFTPAGMWPSEGSVSDEALKIICDCGIKWAATDEAILQHTVPGITGQNREGLYHPYRFGCDGAELGVIFRDHALSDLIGFTYSQWDTGRAIEDFMERLRRIRQQFPTSSLVPVILDGENAWEYYPDNANPFLSTLYAAIAGSAEFRLVTATEAVATIKPKQTLTHIHPGSWINANYGIWVGHPEENLAWDYLERAREAAVTRNPQVAALLAAGRGASNMAVEADDTARLICKALFAAEGSDWFWWYGDDHFSAHADRFDALFRKHLINIYRLLGQDLPRELYEPIKKTREAGFVREPSSFITPVIDGLVTDYFEWLPAGLFDLSRQSSAMHSSESSLHSFFYAYDRESLHLRIDGAVALDQLLGSTDTLYIFIGARQKEYRLAIGRSEDSGYLAAKSASGFRATRNRYRYKIRKICEVTLPLAAIKPVQGEPLQLYITLQRDGEEVGRWPADAPMELKYLGDSLELDNWLI